MLTVCVVQTNSQNSNRFDHLLLLAKWLPTAAYPRELARYGGYCQGGLFCSEGDIERKLNTSENRKIVNCYIDYDKCE